MKKNIYIIVTAVHQKEVSDLFKNFPENNCIYSLLQVDPDPLKKVTDPDPAAQKSTDPTGSGSSSLVLDPGGSGSGKEKYS